MRNGIHIGRCEHCLAASILSFFMLVAAAGIGQAQVVGEEAELDRLRAKAEDAMGNDDAEGAAMNMGRAAMAANSGNVRLNRRCGKYSNPQNTCIDHRSMATGGWLSSGGPVENFPPLPACGSLQLAQLELQHAQETLASSELQTTWCGLPKLPAIRQTADDWAIVLSSMMGEFRCPN